VIEHLVLEIDPFPRAPDAEFTPPEAEPESSPFGKLAQLKAGTKDGTRDGDGQS